MPGGHHCHYGSLRMKNTRNWQMVHTAGSLFLWILSMVILIIIGQSGGVTTAYRTHEPRNEPRTLKCEEVHSRKPPCWRIVGFTLARTCKCTCTCNRRLLYWFLVCIPSSCAVLLAFNPFKSAVLSRLIVFLYIASFRFCCEMNRCD